VICSSKPQRPFDAAFFPDFDRGFALRPTGHQPPLGRRVIRGLRPIACAQDGTAAPALASSGTRPKTWKRRTAFIHRVRIIRIHTARKAV
jgi:hypothetical protein